MAKVKFEFKCTNCPAIFDVKLNVSLNGNYRIHCPGCGHIHYRKLVKGVITDVRFTDNQNNPIIEDILPMKSSIKTKSTETFNDFSQSAQGFMHRLWDEVFSDRV